MAIVQEKKIKSLNVINNGTDTVSNVVVEWYTYADSAPEEYFERVNRTFPLEIEEVDPNSDSFIPFNELTEGIVFGWIQNILESQRIEDMEKRIIDRVNSRAYPTPSPEPEIINKELPW
jgi:hypothetical protein